VAYAIGRSVPRPPLLLLRVAAVRAAETATVAAPPLLRLQMMLQCLASLLIKS